MDNFDDLEATEISFRSEIIFKMFIITKTDFKGIF